MLLAIPRTVLTLTVGFLATLVFGLAVIVTARLKPDSAAIEKFIGMWARSWLIASGTKLTVEGADRLDRSRSYVVVANHLSNFDIMVCFAAIPLPIRYLAKKELFRVPILASAMRAAGMVEVDRQARSLALNSINIQADAVVERGLSLIIYPEGTRSRSGELQPFKKGAFTMAVMNQMPILPVTIHGTRQVWVPERALIYGGKVQVVIGEPIEVAGKTRADVDDLRDEARATIEANLVRAKS